MKRIMAVPIAALAALVLMGQGDPKTPTDLEVRSLVVRDKKGRARLTLELSEAGDPRILLTDESGRGGVTILTKDGPEVSLIADNARRAVVGIKDARGGPLAFLQLAGKNKRPSALFGAAADGRGLMRLMDASGADRVVLGIENAGHASIGLNDSRGVTRLELVTQQDGGSFLGLSESGGTRLATFGMEHDGEPNATFRSSKNRHALALGIREGQPGIALLDKGTPRVLLTFRGGGQLAFLNKTAGIVNHLGELKGVPFIRLADKTGKDRLTLGADGTPSVFRVATFDRDGKTVWESPKR